MGLHTTDTCSSRQALTLTPLSLESCQVAGQVNDALPEDFGLRTEKTLHLLTPKCHRMEEEARCFRI